MYVWLLHVFAKGMKSREERVLHGEVRPEIAKTTIEIENIQEEEPEVFYDRVRGSTYSDNETCLIQCPWGYNFLTLLIRWLFCM